MSRKSPFGGAAIEICRLPWDNTFRCAISMAGDVQALAQAHRSDRCELFFPLRFSNQILGEADYLLSFL